VAIFYIAAPDSGSGTVQVAWIGNCYGGGTAYNIIRWVSTATATAAADILPIQVWIPPGRRTGW